METNRKIPDIVISRLPLYLRALCYLADENQEVTSSQELGARLDISAAQIRKDLSQFGEFGKQGTGYNIAYLINKLSQILQVDQTWDVAIIGAGDVGHALARYSGFHERGFRVAMVFDRDPAKVGTQIDGFTVQSTDHLSKMIQKAKIKIAMIAVPASAAQEIADQLVKGGVKAILNYAPINLSVPSDVRVQYIDPSIHLQRMAYHLNR